MAAAQFKNFLYAFCGKRKIRPVYTERPSKGGSFSFQVKGILVYLMFLLIIHCNQCTESEIASLEFLREILNRMMGVASILGKKLLCCSMCGVNITTCTIGITQTYGYDILSGMDYCS